MQWSRRGWWCIGVMVVVMLIQGCATTSVDEVEEKDNEGLSQQAVEAFERTMERQYRQLGLHYEAYEGLLSGRSVAMVGEESRIHRKLMRRHRRLAQLHEEWVWVLRRQGGGGEEVHRELAGLHRDAQRWHGRSFRGLAPEDFAEEDGELRQIRERLERRSQRVESIASQRDGD